MSTQLSIFDDPRPRVRREAPHAPYAPVSDTSKAAALYIAPKLQRMEQLVLDAIVAICATGKRGATVFDAMNWTGLRKDSVGPRMTSLAQNGLIRKTEKRHPREDADTWCWAWELNQ